MKAKRIVSLSLVAATLVAATWFFRSQEAMLQTTVNNIDVVDSYQTNFIKNQPQNNSSETINIKRLSADISREDREFSVNDSVRREQVIDELQSKFRLLETQYGILSVDDIQQIESSLSDLEELDSLVGLSSALDELLNQY